MNSEKNFSQISWVSLHGSCFLGVNIFAIKCILIQCTQFLEIFLYEIFTKVADLFKGPFNAYIFASSIEKKLPLN